MKKFIPVIIIIISLGYYNSYSQLPVSRTLENKNVVLEEFTGFHCPNCPDGHRRAQMVKDTHPNDVVLVNIHTGYYANPGAGEPDFRTSFGSALANQSGLDGYPSGTVNRHVFSGSNTALGRGQWGSKSDIILGQSSYCNIALEANIDIQTREMTVNVEVYYTANGAPQNNINVALLQDNIEGPQSGSSSNPTQVLPNGHYNHMHMLRHLITGQWGDAITTTSQGTLVQKQYTYTLPADINGVELKLEDIKIAGFVTEGHQEIITGNEGVIHFSGFQHANNLKILSAESNHEICSPNDLDARVKVINYGNNTINSFTINYDINGGTSQSIQYSTPLLPLSKAIIEIPDFSFNVQNINTLNIEAVIDGATDDDMSDNNVTINNINKTTNVGNVSNYVVTIVQDRYGNETTWGILDENENFYAGGGPYSTLSANGTQTHTTNVTLNNNGCYKFVILDSAGDGINGGYGNGHYSMEEAGTGNTVFYGNGQFHSKDVIPFEVTNTNSINDEILANINIYPNPGNGQFTIENSEGAELDIYNMSGIKIYHFEKLPKKMQINLVSLSNGVYLAKFLKDKIITQRKIIISK